MTIQRVEKEEVHQSTTETKLNRTDAAQTADASAADFISLLPLGVPLNICPLFPTTMRPAALVLCFTTSLMRRCPKKS